MYDSFTAFMMSVMAGIIACIIYAWINDHSAK